MTDINGVIKWKLGDISKILKVNILDASPIFSHDPLGYPGQGCLGRWGECWSDLLRCFKFSVSTLAKPISSL